MIDLEQRIKTALNNYCGNKDAMHVPPKDSDVDVVLSDCLNEITAFNTNLANVKQGVDEMAQGFLTEIESLKAQLEAKNNAIIFTDDCRIEWYELAMRKDKELQEVKAQLAQYQSDDWISVSDRLPDDGAVVLVYISDQDIMLDSYPFSFTGETTHWQPMPNPPKEVK